MTQEYSSMANSIIMWLACAPGVLIVLFQAYLFFRRSKKDALRVGLTEKQVKAAIRSATVTSALCGRTAGVAACGLHRFGIL